MLLIVGTYSETLGHVNGKGGGVYVLKVDADDLAVLGTQHPEENSLFGKAQLGSGTDRIRNPTYLTAHRDAESSEVHVYIVDERQDGPGTVTAARLNEETGELTRLGPGGGIVADDRGEGAAACHVSVSPDSDYVLVANYICGSIVAIGRNGDGSLDPSRVQYAHLPPSPQEGEDGVKYPGPNAGRQERSHAHMVLFSKGKSSTTILVPDLGSDVVWSVPYLGPNAPGGRPLGRPVPTARHPSLAGAGPRHVALHPSGRVCYVAYELRSLVAMFEIGEETGAIVGGPLGVVNVLDGAVGAAFLPDSSGSAPGKRYDNLLEDSSTGLDAKVCSDAQTSVAAIRVLSDGSAVLVSSRIVDGEGAVTAIPLGPGGELLAGKGSSGGGAESVSIAGTLGRTPRDFVLLPPGAGSSGGGDGAVAALVANQDTDSIALLRQGREAVMFSEEVPTPVCLCIVPS